MQKMATKPPTSIETQVTLRPSHVSALLPARPRDLFPPHPAGPQRAAAPGAARRRGTGGGRPSGMDFSRSSGDPGKMEG